MTITKKQHDIIRSVQGRKLTLPPPVPDLSEMAAQGLLFSTRTGFNAVRWHVTETGLAEAAAFEEVPA